MKKLVAIFIVNLCLFNTVLFAHENEHVHPFTITGNAGELIKQKLKEPYSELWKSKNNGGYLIRGSLTDDNSIESGSFREDRLLPLLTWDKYGEIPSVSMKNHFYNPWDDKGIDGFRQDIQE